MASVPFLSEKKLRSALGVQLTAAKRSWFEGHRATITTTDNSSLRRDSEVTLAAGETQVRKHSCRRRKSIARDVTQSLTRTDKGEDPALFLELQSMLIGSVV
jgi:hypothetical protein